MGWEQHHFPGKHGLRNAALGQIQVTSVELYSLFEKQKIVSPNPPESPGFTQGCLQTDWSCFGGDRLFSLQKKQKKKKSVFQTLGGGKKGLLCCGHLHPAYRRRNGEVGWARRPRGPRRAEPAGAEGSVSPGMRRRETRNGMQPTSGYLPLRWATSGVALKSEAVQRNGSSWRTRTDSQFVSKNEVARSLSQSLSLSDVSLSPSFTRATHSFIRSSCATSCIALAVSRPGGLGAVNTWTLRWRACRSRSGARAGAGLAHRQSTMPTAVPRSAPCPRCRW